MSKSKGNVVYSQPIVARYGADALRYYLMREMPFGADGNYTNEAFLTRMNADLANDMGNLLSRTVAMIEKYFGSVIPAPGEFEDVDRALIERAKELPRVVEREMNALQFSLALQEIWKLIGECNRYIDITQPWVLGRDEAGKARLSTVMYILSECIRFIAVLIGPVMPSTPEKIFEQLGLHDEKLMTWESLESFGLLPTGIQVKKGNAIFPRADISKELEALALGQEVMQSQAKPDKKMEEKAQAGETQKAAESITIDDFSKLDLRMAKVLHCEAVPKSDKLLQFTLDLGTEQRTVLSGIAKCYRPEQLIGRQVVLLANLAPRKIRGIMSQGMILSAASADGEKLSLLSCDSEMLPGAEIS